MAIGFYGVVALFAFGYALFSQNLYQFLGDQAPTGAALLGGLAFGAVIVGVTRLGLKVWSVMDDAARSFALLLGPMRRREAIYIALASGIAEELLFRGALWTHLGFLGTTLLFGLVHIVPKRALWAYPVYATACGALLGLLRHATGSVLPCILAHVLVNGIHLVYLADRHEAYAREEAARSALQP
jgi:membrane protease YdiL (CAAX protease family)